jgi:hypothetical protein
VNARELDQDPVSVTALRVPEQRHDNMAVAKVKDGLRSVPGEASQLDAVSAMCVLRG